MAEAWAPTLADVARHIPTRTRDTAKVGSDVLFGTFTETTTPTAEQAQADIDNAVRGLAALVGPVPTAGDPVVVASLQAMARDAAEWRAAADIELAYPDRDANVRVAAQLDQRAKDALVALKAAYAEAEIGAVESVPVWAFPAPPAWGDDLLL